MTQLDDGELAALRRRAYGPDADIDGDPEAVRRLRELEAKGHGVGTAARAVAERREARAAAEPGMQASAVGQSEAAVQPPSSAWSPEEVQVSAGVEGDAEEAGERSRRSWWPRTRRARVVAAVAVLAVAAVVAAGLTLAQRAQGDSLRVGGRQLARLVVDPSDEIPLAVSATWGGGNDGVLGFRQFHGLRVVVDQNPTETAAPQNDDCVDVYAAKAGSTGSAADSTVTSGQLFRGCAAGAFPATVQFRVSDDSPAALRSAFPRGTALQFVYDRPHREILVFADR